MPLPRPVQLVAAAIAVLGGAGCVAAPVASAAQTPPQRIYTDGINGPIKVESSPDGSASLVYESWGRLFARTKAPGGQFGPATALGDVEGGMYGDTWRLVASPSGRMLIVWQTQHDIWFAVREPGGVFSGRQHAFASELQDPHIVSIMSLAAAVGDDGRLFLAYGDTDGATLGVREPGQAFRKVAQVETRTAYSQYQKVDISTSAFDMGLAIQDGGRGVVLAAAVELPNEDFAMASTRWTVDGGTEPTTYFQRGRSHNHLSLVPIPGALPTFIWNRGGGNGSVYTHDVVQATVRPGAPAPAPTVLDATTTDMTGGDEPAVSLGLDASGVGTVGWIPQERRGGQPELVRLMQQRSPGAGFTPVTIHPELTDGKSPPGRGLVLAATTGGGARMWWAGPEFSTRSATIAPDGSISPVVTTPLPEGAENDFVAAATGSGDGDTLAVRVWDPRFGEEYMAVEFDDVHPPQLTAAVASSVDAGAGLTAVELRADASDTWTPTTVRWSFEDGTTADGPSVRRVVRTGTAARVRVTATDAAGNATSRELVVGGSSVPQADHVATPAPAATPAATPPASAALPVPGTAGTPRPPVASKLRFANKRFLPGTRVTRTRGTTLRFSLTERAALELEIVRVDRGTKAGSRCSTKAARGAIAARCSVKTDVGSMKLTGRAGTNAVPFPGQLDGRRLPPGTYALRVTPTSATGVRGATSTVHFVVRS